MNIRICDCCGKKLGPLNTFTLTIKAGEFVTLSHMQNIEYDLCKDCMEIVKGVIRKNISKEES